MTMGGAWRRAYPRMRSPFRGAFGRDAPVAAKSVDLLIRLAPRLAAFALMRKASDYGLAGHG